MNIINGGAHADNGLKIQEFMIRPDSANNFMDAIEKCFLVIQKLKFLINSKNLSTTVGDEGGFAPALPNNEAAIEFIIDAINKAIESTKSLSLWLKNESSKKNGLSGIGKENYTWYQQNVHLLPLTWEEEVALLQR